MTPLPQSATGIRTSVVAAKFPNKFIIRGIKKWSTTTSVLERMQPYLALFSEDEYELTSCDYFTPFYLFYGCGDIESGPRFYDGLYRFNHAGNGVYNNAQKLASW